MYMNKTKRNLILAAAILNLVTVVVGIVFDVIVRVYPEKFAELFAENNYLYTYFMQINNPNGKYALVSDIITACLGLIGSILLFYCIRESGRYFRNSRGAYIAGLIIVIFAGDFISWILLLIASFVPDIIINNDVEQLRREYREAQNEEILHNKAYEIKKAKIEELKRLRDAGAITEEEYKEKLFELL